MTAARRLRAWGLRATALLLGLSIFVATLSGSVSAQAQAPWTPGDATVVEPVAPSAKGRLITATRIGRADAPVRLVIIGQVHGNEPAGPAVVGELLRRLTAEGGLDAVQGVAVWVISSLNPDGAQVGTRVNARGVDLNRNFPASWSKAGAGTSQWSGPGPGSEVEVQGLMSFLSKVRPTAVVVLHQDYAVVDITHRRSVRAGERLAELLRLPARPVGCPGRCHGTLTQWVDREFRAIALTVELPGRVPVTRVRRYAAALESFATWLAGRPSR